MDVCHVDLALFYEGSKANWQRVIFEGESWHVPTLLYFTFGDRYHLNSTRSTLTTSGRIFQSF